MITKYHEVNSIMLEQDFYEALGKLQIEAKKRDPKVPDGFRDWLKVILVVGSGQIRANLEQMDKQNNLIQPAVVIPQGMAEAAKRLQDLKRGIQ
jgi:hypothetical protein